MLSSTVAWAALSIVIDSSARMVWSIGCERESGTETPFDVRPPRRSMGDQCSPMMMTYDHWNAETLVLALGVEPQSLSGLKVVNPQ